MAETINRIKMESLIYGAYTRHNVLDKLVYDTFSNTSIAEATQLNIYVDLNSILHPVFSEHFRIDMNEATTITSCLINLCGHYRQFFRRLRVNTKFFLIFSYNTCEINRKFVASYNSFFKAKSEIKQFRDIVNVNLELLDTLCPYIPDVFFIKSTNDFEVGVIMSHLMSIVMNDGNPNLIISKDLYPYQLVPNHPYTSYLYPCKHLGEDTSRMTPISEKQNFRYEFWNIVSRDRKLNIDRLMKISPLNYPLFISITGFKRRCINQIHSIYDAIKIITTLVGEEDIKIIPEMLMSNEEIVSHYSVAQIIANYKALDISYMVPYYSANPESKAIKLLNIRDDAVLNQVCSSKEFTANPINLQAL